MCEKKVPFLDQPANPVKLPRQCDTQFNNYRGLTIRDYAEIQFIKSMIHKNVNENDILEITQKAKLIVGIWAQDKD